MLPAAATQRAALPGVTWIDGKRVVAATVRALTGADEVALAPLLGHASPTEIGITIAARCCPTLHTENGGQLDTTPSLVWSLAVGDREALLLHVQAATYGNQLALVVDCPACGAAMDLTLDVDDLLARPLDEPDEEVPCGEHALRRPTGADQRAVATIALDDPVSAAAALVRLCVTGGDAVSLPVDEAEAALDRADPQAACELALNCVECKAAFTSDLDAGDILAHELAAIAGAFDVSVHILAAHYHWSYAEIVELPVTRRRRFVNLVSDAVTAGIG